MTEQNEVVSSQIKQLPSMPPLVAKEEAPGNMLVALLKSPGHVAKTIVEGEHPIRTGVFFLICAVIFHAIFGLAVGLFSGWQVGGMAAVKSPLIALSSLFLCFPSLYVFSACGGSFLSIRQTFILGSSCLAMIGLLLIALAPVAWLFAVSTNGLAFVVSLILIIWVIAVSFVIRYINKLKAAGLFQRIPGIAAWLLVFIFVSLQMTTSMRPILTPPEQSKTWWTAEKQFFLQHFGSCFDTQKQPRK